MPPGSPRFWSWLFAAPAMRDALLGVHALEAELRALLAPQLDAAVVQHKIAWWHDELERLTRDAPLHPITRYLAGLPRAGDAGFDALQRSLEAVASQVAGAPLERASDLERHAQALYGPPQWVACRLAGIGAGGAGLDECILSLAAGDYLVRAVTERRQDARCGRVLFAIEELLAAGIGNDELAAGAPSAALAAYLDTLRLRADRYFTAAASALAPPQRPALRHLLVLAALGSRRTRGSWPPTADFRFGDMYNAWTSARRAARGR